ncbi:hypothetical protein L1887_47949 [Cichorium endivia]|nr:hypothetical protein L1887_47949 [Cichorium endivia]
MLLHFDIMASFYGQRSLQCLVRRRVMSWPGLARLCLYLFLLVTQVDSSLLAQRPRDKFCATPGGEKVDEHDEKHSSPDDGVPPAPFSLPREIAFVLMICLAQFLSLASLAQSIAPMEIIGRSFGLVSEAELSWFPASFSLTYGTFILPAGRLVSESHNHWKADTLTDQQ